MDETTLKKQILSRTDKKSGRPMLSCAKAFEVASETGATLSRIGEICNEEGVKIITCQLGCFGGGHG